MLCGFISLLIAERFFFFLFLKYLLVVVVTFSDDPRALPLLGEGGGRGVQGERRCYRPGPPEAGDLI